MPIQLVFLLLIIIFFYMLLYSPLNKFFINFILKKDNSDLEELKIKYEALKVQLMQQKEEIRELKKIVFDSKKNMS